jgi:hypothetical protein
LKHLEQQETIATSLGIQNRLGFCDLLLEYPINTNFEIVLIVEIKKELNSKFDAFNKMQSESDFKK